MGLMDRLGQAGRGLARVGAGLTEKREQLSDGEICYLRGGSGEPAVFLHSFGGNKDQWVSFARPLKGKLELLLIDLPGFGDSHRNAHGRYDVVSQVRRLRALVQKLSLKSVHLVGVGLGADIAGVYASLFAGGTRSLAMIEPWGVQTEAKSELQKMMDRGHAPLVVRTENEYARVQKMQLKSPPAPAKAQVQQAVEDRQLHARIWEHVWTQRPYLLGTVLTEIKVPTLLLWGGGNQMVHREALELLQKGLPQSQTEVYRDSGHLVMVEKAKAASDRYRKFLDSLA